MKDLLGRELLVEGFVLKLVWRNEVRPLLLLKERICWGTKQRRAVGLLLLLLLL